jgi:hypothetical protein
MPLNINSGGSRQSGNRISDFPAGEVFEFSGSTKGNNGLCVRVKDSKKGKGRFVNLNSGKLLRATNGDRGQVVDAYLDYEV